MVSYGNTHIPYLISHTPSKPIVLTLLEESKSSVIVIVIVIGGVARWVRLIYRRA